MWDEFVKTSPRDKGGSNFHVISSKLLIFEKIPARDNRHSSKIQLVIIGEGQVFKSHQENCLISAKILSRDNRASSIFQ